MDHCAVKECPLCCTCHLQSRRLKPKLILFLLCSQLPFLGVESKIARFSVQIFALPPLDAASMFARLPIYQGLDFLYLYPSAIFCCHPHPPSLHFYPKIVFLQRLFGSIIFQLANDHQMFVPSVSFWQIWWSQWIAKLILSSSAASRTVLPLPPLPYGSKLTDGWTISLIRTALAAPCHPSPHCGCNSVTLNWLVMISSAFRLDLSKLWYEPVKQQSRLFIKKIVL